MRKAVWGAILLGIFALATMWPVSEVPGIHVLSLAAGFIAFFLLSRDPPAADVRLYRAYLIAAIVAGLASFVLVQVSASDSPLRPLARFLSVAVVALALWLPARWERYVFVAAGAVALTTLFANEVALVRNLSIPTFGLTAVGAALVAYRLDGRSFRAPRKLPRVAVASNIVTLSQAEKDARLAALEAKFRAGEIPEHKYWDKRQEIESR